MIDVRGNRVVALQQGYARHPSAAVIDDGACWRLRQTAAMLVSGRPEPQNAKPLTRQADALREAARVELTALQQVTDGMDVGIFKARGPPGVPGRRTHAPPGAVVRASPCHWLTPPPLTGRRRTHAQLARSRCAKTSAGLLLADSWLTSG